MTLSSDSLEEFFNAKIEKLPCQRSTKAYIYSIFSSPKKNNDFSKDSITIIYSKAKSEYSLELFQGLADWILFAQTMYPDSLNHASPEYYQTIAQISYYRCYRIVNRSWALYEELADNLPLIIKMMRVSLALDQMESPPSLFLLTGT